MNSSNGLLQSFLVLYTPYCTSNGLTRMLLVCAAWYSPCRLRGQCAKSARVPTKPTFAARWGLPCIPENARENMHCCEKTYNTPYIKKNFIFLFLVKHLGNFSTIMIFIT